MTDFEQKLWNFEVGLKDALEQLGKLRAENEDLTKSNQQLVGALSEQKNLTKDIEENNKSVKLAETMTRTMGDQSELKKQIDGYIKEIDRCIALLSD
ncbi:MAG: putative nuclease with TOPRIM domain [Bacteroidia bacterium]|jgi:predicted nuclease with TOPRIM domain